MSETVKAKEEQDDMLQMQEDEWTGTSKWRAAWDRGLLASQHAMSTSCEEELFDSTFTDTFSCHSC